jgi:hypothetical protein
MADLTNRSRYRVSVKNRDDLTAYFPFNKFKAVEAHVEELKGQGYKPHTDQLDESWLVRIREKGHKEQFLTFESQEEADGFLSDTAAERKRGLFVDYAASLKVSLADLIVRYLLDEAPKHKSHRVIAYSLEGWLADSGPDGLKLLAKYRDELHARGMPVRAAKFCMRTTNDELAWIHKRLGASETADSSWSQRTSVFPRQSTLDALLLGPLRIERPARLQVARDR